MRKWRPTYKCIYVLPEIHGSFDLLKIMMDRIIPLRFSVNQEDRIILLGDYIDKGSDSASVIDLLVKYKNLYENNFICIKGNHEFLMLNALSSEKNYKEWLMQGGLATVASYIAKAGLTSDASSFPFSRISDIIPQSHVDFLRSLPTSVGLDEYIFFHGGINISNPEDTQDLTYMFDLSASKNVKQALKVGQNLLKESNKIYIGAHNFKSKTPFVSSKYFMLGGSAPINLILFELNSMSCVMIKKNKTRIYKHNFKYVE